MALIVDNEVRYGIESHSFLHLKTSESIIQTFNKVRQWNFIDLVN